MQRHYSSKRLSENEWREIEGVLLDELDIQCWFAVTSLEWLGGETLLTLQ